MNNETIDNISLTEKVYLYLYDAILSGAYRPDKRLLVLDISNELQLSQAPVREALERLKQEGLVNKEPNKSAVVSSVSINEIENIYQLRELLEGFAVKEAMKTIHSQDIEQLYQIYGEMKAMTKLGDIFRLNELDMRFHTFFYERCGNALILNIWKEISVKIIRFISHTNKIYFKNLEDVAESHLSLIKVVESGNVEKAGDLFSAHMKEVWWRIKKNDTFNHL